MNAIPHSVALNFEDGLTRIVQTRPNETVADAAYRVGINIPLDCRDGACGTCRVFVEAGSFDAGDYLEDALTDDEAAEGYGLACQMKPHSDLVLRIAAASDACKIKATATKTTLAAVDPSLGDHLRVLAHRLTEPVGFLAGQYVSIHVPGSDQKRSYSFSSAPGSDRLDFLVRDIPGGLMSEFLRTAQPGTPVEFSGPSGTFYLRDVKRPLLFLAGGTGLAPFMAMLGRLRVRCHHRGPADPPDLRRDQRCRSGRSRGAGRTYAATLPGVQLPNLRRRPGQHPPHSAATSPPTSRPSTCYGGDVDVYLCGPPAMVDNVRSRARGDARKLLLREVLARRCRDRRGRGAPVIFARRFEGKIAVVTGAAQGIGLAVARRMAAEGGRVVMVDRADLVQRGGRGDRCHCGSSPTSNAIDECERVMAAAGGPIDILVNNVGGTIWARPYAEYAQAQIEAEIRRSLFPTLWACRAVLPYMIAQRRGVIVNVSSIATRGVNRVPYAAAKGGVDALTASLAFEYAGHGIRVCATAPGGTDAPPRQIPRNSDAPSDQEKGLVSGGRRSDASPPASCIATAPSRNRLARSCSWPPTTASYITGTTLPVAGGDLG